MVRPCTLKDLDDLMDLQKKISAGMERKEWFVETSRSENEKFFEKPNQVFGVYEKERLVAYGTIGFLEDDEGNYGWELGWTEEKVHTCANLDTIVRNLPINCVILHSHCRYYVPLRLPPIRNTFSPSLYAFSLPFGDG